MSEQEMSALSTKDRDRLRVLHEVKGEHLTQRAVAQQLGISDRWVRELLGRVKRTATAGWYTHLPSSRAPAETLPG